MAVIKANAYGHGLLPVANCLSNADCFAVARLGEASDLRAGGVETPIALLGGVFHRDDLARAIELDLQLAVHTESQVDWLEQYGDANLVVWLKIDTGMNRLGFRSDEAVGLTERLQSCKAVKELRIMTHFANADDTKDVRTRIQLAEFECFVSQFAGDVSVANSPGILG